MTPHVSPFGRPTNSRFYTRASTEDSIKYVNTSKLDDRFIVVDLDMGFTEGRQYGRAKKGGKRGKRSGSGAGARAGGAGAGAGAGGTPADAST